MPQTIIERLPRGLGWFSLGLGAAIAGVSLTRRRRAADPAATAGATDQAGKQAEKEEAHAMRAKSAVTVKRPIDEVYRYCRDFENLGRIFDHVDSVEAGEGGRSRWTICAAGGRKVEWEAELTEDAPNSVIAWRAADGNTPGSGRVEFRPAPADQGTEVTVELEYSTPGGAVGETLIKLVDGDPSEHVKEDLRRFKQVMEAGEVVRSDGSPHGARPLRALKQRPAQPLP